MYSNERGGCMGVSLKFQHIENNLVKLFTLLYESANISKYVYYLVDNPLSMPDVSVDLLENGNYILNVFDDKILQDDKVRIFLNPYNGDLRDIPIGEITYVMDIIIPNKYWVLNGLGQLRAFRIADEFSKLVDGQYVAGLGQVNITYFKIYKVNDSYSGLSLFIKINTPTVKAGV
jgi:hypothetical protein